MINETIIGNGKVYLLAGGGKVWTDVAARFVRSERPVEEIIESPYSPELLHKILDSNHKAALEFDYFLFGVEGFSRVCETQLVRKRHASYLIKSGRSELGGKRKFEVALPSGLENVRISYKPEIIDFISPDGCDGLPELKCHRYKNTGDDGYFFPIGINEILDILSQWYEKAVESGVKEEDARYLKPQATTFKGIIGMNAHALYDFFGVRCCMNAQAEIRDLANKMLALCKDAAPDLFANAGPNCKQLGYCPENSMQNVKCIGHILTKDKALSILRNSAHDNVISG